MKIIIADPFAPLRGPTPTPIPSPPTPLEPSVEKVEKVEKKWFIERRDALRSSRPPAFFVPPGALATASIDDPLADNWFR